MNTDSYGIRGRNAEGHAGHDGAIGKRARLEPRSINLRIAAVSCAALATVLNRRQSTGHRRHVLGRVRDDDGCVQDTPAHQSGDLGTRAAAIGRGTCAG